VHDVIRKFVNNLLFSMIKIFACHSVLLHAVPFKTVSYQVHTVSPATVPLLEACTNVSSSELHKCWVWGVQRAWDNSHADMGQKFCTDRRVGRNIVMVKKPTVLCHFCHLVLYNSCIEMLAGSLSPWNKL